MNSTSLTIEKIKSQTAIVILAFAEYESLELALATHAKFSVESGLPIYILQNGRGTYDTERTYQVGKRYANLFPNTIKVVTHIPAKKPYSAIKKLLHDPVFSGYKYIIKLDDDVMVLTPDWIDKLIGCYIQSSEKAGSDLAYVTSLVNNNPFGFKQIIESNDSLSKEYFERLARPHIIGCSPDNNYNPYRIVSKETVFGGGFGTIWSLPYVARWIHKKTTMKPLAFIEDTRNLKIKEVNAKERYSINCMLFDKGLWDAIDDGSLDDEHMVHVYCMLNKKKIFADLSIPMVHIAFYSQREELRDMIPEIRDVYTGFLSLPFPIAICNDRLIEIESRLRFYEKNSIHVSQGNRVIKKIKGGIQCFKEHGFKYTFNRGLVHLHLKKE